VTEDEKFLHNMAHEFEEGFNSGDADRIMRFYADTDVDYYQGTRTHLSLDKDCPDPRPIMPRRIGKVVAIAKVGGLHHRYERLAA
jgi:hypothetical protein